MFNLKTLLGFKSPLGKEIHKEFELEQRDTLLKQVDFLYNQYKVLAEKAETLTDVQLLVKDFASIIDMVIKNDEGEVTDGLQLSGQEETAGEESAGSDIETTIESSAEQLESATKSDEPSANSGVMVFKDANGRNRWMGIVSNNFTDRHAEIISKEAHLEFVDAVHKGDYPYPPLLFHHDSDFIIGKSDYVNFDETSGMLVASGTFDPLWEEIGDNLAKSEYSWGMSHGMPPHEIKMYPNSKRVYKRYRDAEFTLLRLPKAANAFTSMI